MKQGKRVMRRYLFPFAPFAALIAGAGGIAFFVACADSDPIDGPIPPEDSGAVETSLPEAGDLDAADARADVDAEALRCSGQTCLLDLPNAPAAGLTKWMFAGVFADPTIGVWAVANGVEGVDDAATAQLLRLDGDAWKVDRAITFGADGRSVRLLAISGDGKGKLLAVGVTKDQGIGVVVRGDGTSFTVERLAEDLRAAWVAAPNDAYVVGGDGGVFHSAPDGGWVFEGKRPASFNAVWGSGPGDVYVGGASPNEFDDIGYVGHRTVNDAGVRRWTYSQFPSDTQEVGTRQIYSGVSREPGSAFWMGANFFGTRGILARTPALDAGGIDAGGEQIWSRDSFDPPVDFRSFYRRGPSDIWAAGGLGRLYHYDGSTWKDSLLVFNGAPLTAHLAGVTGTASGDLYVVGEGVALRRKP